MALPIRYLKAPRRLLFTRDGRWFVGMTLMVGFGAVNTGNNLLYLLLGMMLGLIIVSGILSEWMLQKLTISRIPGADIFAGRPSTVTFEVRNGKSRLSSYSIIVREHESRPTRALRRTALGLPAERPRSSKQREAENEPGPPGALAMRIPAGKSAVISGDYLFPRRGLYQYVGLDVGTRFPFGFFEKSRRIPEVSEILVYPEILTNPDEPARNPAMEGEVDRAYEGRSGDFFGLREFRTGDDRRDVHWKVSARRNQLVRRLYEKQDNESVAIHVYNWAPPGESAANVAELREVENTISRAATVCMRLAQQGHRFSLHTIDEYVIEGSGAGQLQTVLRQLALLQVRRDAEAPPLQASRSSQRLLFAPGHAPASVHAMFSKSSVERAA